MIFSIALSVGTDRRGMRFDVLDANIISAGLGFLDVDDSTQEGLDSGFTLEASLDQAADGGGALGVEGEASSPTLVVMRVSVIAVSATTRMEKLSSALGNRRRS